MKETRLDRFLDWWHSYIKHGGRFHYRNGVCVKCQYIERTGMFSRRNF